MSPIIISKIAIGVNDFIEYFCMDIRPENMHFVRWERKAKIKAELLENFT